MNCAEGSIPTTREDMMRSFDELPQAVRQALADAPENWVPQPFHMNLRRYSPDYVAMRIRAESERVIRESIYG